MWKHVIPFYPTETFFFQVFEAKLHFNIFVRKYVDFQNFQRQNNTQIVGKLTKKEKKKIWWMLNIQINIYSIRLRKLSLYTQNGFCLYLFWNLYFQYLTRNFVCGFKNFINHVSNILDYLFQQYIELLFKLQIWGKFT